jgi:hypothetical protein
MEQPPKTKLEHDILDWAHGAGYGETADFAGKTYKICRATIITPQEFTRRALEMLCGQLDKGKAV